MAFFALALERVTRAFPGVVACSEVTLRLAAGKVHALVGRNGAGKTTCLNILGGMIRPDRGSVEVEGRRVEFGSPAEARRVGVVAINQSLPFIPTLTVRDNIRLLSGWTHLSTEVPDRQLAPIWDRPAGSLTARERQLASIACLAKHRGKLKVLLLDEPTTWLSAGDTALLYGKLRELAESGVAILVNTHKISEVLSYCDLATVLREGQVVQTVPTTAVTAHDLFSYIEGTTVPDAPEAISAREVAGGEALVTLEDLYAAGDGTRLPALNGVSLTVRPGEVLGVVGVPGSGVETLAEVLCGRQKPSAGRLRTAAGVHLENSGWIPSDRSLAVVPTLSVAENLCLRKRSLLAPVSPSRRAECKQFAKDLISAFGIEPPRADLNVGWLSGGNQQKLVVARELDFADSLLVAMHPSAGLSPGVARLLRRCVLERVSRGRLAVVLISDDPEELLVWASRIVVIERGRVIESFDGAEISGSALRRTLMDAWTPDTEGSTRS